MHHVTIGGGPAATNAVETIRQFDGGRSDITLVCDEPAHSRMALPYWLAGDIGEGQTHTGDAAYFARLKVATRFGVRATAVDPQGKTVTLAGGSHLADVGNIDRDLFGRCVMADLDAPAASSDVQLHWRTAHRVLQAALGLNRKARRLLGDQRFDHVFEIKVADPRHCRHVDLDLAVEAVERVVGLI